MTEQESGTYIGDLFNKKRKEINDSKKNKEKRLRICIQKELRSDKLPDTYEIEIEDKMSKLEKKEGKIQKFVFTHIHDDENARSFEGVVTKSGKLKAVEDEKHVEKVVKRNKTTLHEALSTKETLELEESPLATNQIRFGQEIPTRRSEQPTEGMTLAKRIDRVKLREMILAKFEQKEHWKARDMNKDFRQKDGYLKETLREVAEYINSGEHHGCYRIKAQYRLTKFKK